MDTKAISFVKEVISKLPEIKDERDRNMVKAGAFGHFRMGWSVDDSVSFNKLLEEVNPIDDSDRTIADNEESDRLQKMSEISKKYK